MMRFFQSIFLLLLFFGNSLEAATVVQTQAFDMQRSFGTSANFGSSSFIPLTDADVMGFQQFDQSLGALNSVEFTINLNVRSNGISIFSDTSSGNNAVSGVSTLSASVDFSAAGLNLTKLTGDRQLSCNDAAAFSLLAQCSNNFSNQFHPVFNPNPTTVSIASSNILDYIGGGTILVDSFQDAHFRSTNLGPSASFIDSQSAFLRSSGTVTLTYHYSEIPIPASGILFGSAFVILGMLRKPGKTTSVAT